MTKMGRLGGYRRGMSLAELLIAMVLGFLMLSLLYTITASALKHLAFFDERQDAEMMMNTVFRELEFDLKGSSSDGTAGFSAEGWSGYSIALQTQASDSGDRNWRDVPVYYGVSGLENRMVRLEKAAGPQLLDAPPGGKGADFLSALSGGVWQAKKFSGVKSIQLQLKEGQTLVNCSFLLKKSDGGPEELRRSMIVSYRL